MKTLSVQPCIHEHEAMDMAMAHDLLRQHGYTLICRFDHLHASKGTQELHLCLVADLASMCPSHLLACLDEAIKHSLEYTLPLGSRAVSKVER